MDLEATLTYHVQLWWVRCYPHTPRITEYPVHSYVFFTLPVDWSNKLLPTHRGPYQQATDSVYMIEELVSGKRTTTHIHNLTIGSGPAQRTGVHRRVGLDLERPVTAEKHTKPWFTWTSSTTTSVQAQRKRSSQKNTSSYGECYLSKPLHISHRLSSHDTHILSPQIWLTSHSHLHIHWYLHN